MSVLFILFALGGIQEGVSDETPSAQDVTQLVEQLGDRKFAVRQAATSKLKKLGRAAIPALREAKANGTPELQARAESLLGYLLGSAARRAFLRNPVVSTARDVHAWERVRELVGSDEEGIQVLQSWLTAEPRLFEAQVLGGRDLAAELTGRCAELTKYTREKRPESEVLTSISAIAFVISDSTTELTSDARRAAESIFKMSLMKKSLSPALKNDARMRRLAGDWVRRPGSQYQKLILSLDYSLPEGLPLAESIVASKARGPRMMYALHLVGKLGGEKQIPLLVSQLQNNVRLSPPLVGAVRGKDGRRSPRTYEYRVRDIALAMLWHLHGENPAEHGFDGKRLKPSKRYLFALESMGFTSEEQRDAAFAEWEKFNQTKSRR